ncbi:helix-turn-helix domain-containing protein [Streptomyces sp. AC495_CC817]|uniref:helix-turn-helix domain-containing protein n=1 Tax=Streptomyces sp. AC495_CC817 TaxID=2823900 RepID=UPI001C2626AE|nr:helix-turn-helix transcriptional regulator [Streptomyces sp. AC495_CC817]
MADLVPFPRAPRRPSDPEPLWRQLLGDQLRRRRHDRDETLTETAEKAGVSPQYLSEVERGLKEPSSEMIAAIAGALDSSLVELTSAVADELRTAAPVSTGVSASAFALAA